VHAYTGKAKPSIECRSTTLSKIQHVTKGDMGDGVRRSAHRQVGPRTHARRVKQSRREPARKEHNVG
jgi:hypothetical protein